MTTHSSTIITNPSAATLRSTAFATPLGTPGKASRTLRKSTSLGGPTLSTISSPNLNALYTSQAQSQSLRLKPPNLSRKASLAALTSSSLATIPDATESYAFSTSVLNDNMAPLTPGRPSFGGAAAADLAIGDTVDVPGSMFGVVRFVGPVQGKKGTFVGVELQSEHAARGKNNGDVDGVSYFTTTVPGAGIFLPAAKAVKRDSPPTSAGSFPLTPTVSSIGGLKAGTQNSTNYTPPTPSLSKFSQSVGPGRAPSPQGKRPRPSLPRPESPVRRMQMTPGPRPSIATPAANRFPGKYGSPTQNRFAASVRGTAGDPAKRPKMERKGSIGPRSTSALGHASGFTDDETTPVGIPKSKPNGSLGSVSSFNAKMRPSSRANGIADEELERLRAQLEDKDRQLKEQAVTLAEMESSLMEVQALMDHPDGPRLKRSSLDDKDSAQLRATLREKNEKIAMLTAEFDAHRADFRSTIDTLEMASTETERVYEKKIEELMQEIHEFENNTTNVQAVAQQLKQLEELVQELEEGLEDARRGEAEARGEVEFLRGEVERTQLELKQEREIVSATQNRVNGGMHGDAVPIHKELERKEDEIRGLKAIIHSLSRDSVPGDAPLKTPRTNSFGNQKVGDAMDTKAREKLERELSELKTRLDDKTRREEELERELEALRRGSYTAQRASTMTAGPAQRSSLRDSRDTVILSRGSHETRMPESHKRGNTLDTHPESDAYSTATENSTLWCELCETTGHDILSCTNVFDSEGGPTPSAEQPPKTAVKEASKPLSSLQPLPSGYDDKPAPLSPVKIKTPAAAPAIKILPNPMESGPVAGKESGIVDINKWCALCERDGHESVDCPFEDAF